MRKIRGLTVLYKIKDWCILEGSDQIVGSHTSCEAAGKMSWMAHEKPKCQHCGDSLPEEIQTLMHLMESF